MLPDVEDIPEQVDVVDVFQRTDVVPPIATSAVKIGARILWLQLGVVSDKAADIATDGGLEVIMNRCMKIEHARLLGGRSLFGVSTGVISSKRPKWLVY